VDGAAGQAPRLVKGYPLRVSMKSLVRMASLSITLPVWDWK